MQDYEDIIHLPHHVSETHPRMSRLNRAAQFSPFAALTGYGAAIQEAGRLTDRKIQLDEDSQAVLDRKLAILREQLSKRPEVTVTYFQPDGKKDGGAYASFSGQVKKIQDYEQLLVFTDGTQIPFSDILDLDGEMFE
ncbi:MAG TPA: hypothetical protein IAB51_12980 [Candidatus Merdivicinus excrementipullorum]|uniref:YolD-like family protein n=1 Tax=Candidatus Merdivicinus excrementipullorum TaxID=2840867 RepID=A0A9D1K0U9_9FIRM|nr:hypothetical protein [Candidatus Merdivicinus excrementipullorum]